MSDQAADPKKPDEAQSDPASTSSDSTATSKDDAFLGSYGNRAGSTINSTLSPVGAPLGKGLETVTRPVGNVVDALVGGVMRSGAAHGDIAGVGAGNMDKKRDEENERLREPLGGEEQTGQNPLGLRD
ncbi:hypothetical protein MMC29_007624 [Sticta canariensis]|nr:hypothetical protein [Sticta canariensis]